MLSISVRLADSGFDTERALSIQIAIHSRLVGRPFASAPRI